MLKKYPKIRTSVAIAAICLLTAAAVLAVTEYNEGTSLPDDLSGCIVVFYKDGCPDCKATMGQIQDAFKGTKDVFFLDSQSDTSKRIRERYPIQEVPSAVYVHISDEDYTMYVLYERTKDGPVTNFDAINRIIEVKDSLR